MCYMNQLVVNREDLIKYEGVIKSIITVICDDFVAFWTGFNIY